MPQFPQRCRRFDDETLGQELTDLLEELRFQCTSGTRIPVTDFGRRGRELNLGILRGRSLGILRGRSSGVLGYHLILRLGSGRGSQATFTFGYLSPGHADRLAVGAARSSPRDPRGPRRRSRRPPGIDEKLRERLCCPCEKPSTFIGSHAKQLFTDLEDQLDAAIAANAGMPLQASAYRNRTSASRLRGSRLGVRLRDQLRSQNNNDLHSLERLYAIIHASIPRFPVVPFGPKSQ